MLDQNALMSPNAEAEENVTPQAQPVQPVRRDHVFAMMPLIVVGYALVLVALLLLPWPTGQYGEQEVGFVPHILRIICPLPDEVATSSPPSVPVLGFQCYPWDGAHPNFPRRLLDIAIYGVVIVGIYLLAMAVRRGTRGSLAALIVFSVVGLSYVGGMALYTAPAISVFGYLLILFGALVAFASFPPEGIAQAPRKQTEAVTEVEEAPVEDSYDASYDQQQDEQQIVE